MKSSCLKTLNTHVYYQLAAAGSSYLEKKNLHLSLSSPTTEVIFKFLKDLLFSHLSLPLIPSSSLNKLQAMGLEIWRIGAKGQESKFVVGLISCGE